MIMTPSHLIVVLERFRAKTLHDKGRALTDQQISDICTRVASQANQPRLLILFPDVRLDAVMGMLCEEIVGI